MGKSKISARAAKETRWRFNAFLKNKQTIISQQ